MLGYEKPDILHKIKNFGKSSQTQPTNYNNKENINQKKVNQQRWWRNIGLYE